MIITELQQAYSNLAWIKSTSQSCVVVSVAVAASTVVVDVAAAAVVVISFLPAS